MRTIVSAVAAAILVLGAAGTAGAAPQMLGVVATAEPLKLHCADTTCRTEITTICLQAERATPGKHQRYEAHDLAVFTLRATDAAGRHHRVPLHAAQFRSERGYTAVRVEIDTAALGARGLVPRALTVAPGGLLIPHAAAADPDPIDADEIADARARLQPVAAKVFKTHGTEVEAIRLVNRLVNETPAHGRLAKDVRRDLWENSMGETAREAVSPGARRAADVLGYCQYRTKQGRFFSVRRCLEQRLDGMLMDINHEYWRAVQPGS